MKALCYFAHDATARRDPQMLVMTSKYGGLGYCWYFVTVEVLRTQPNYMMPLNKHTCIALQAEYHFLADVVPSLEKVKEFLEDAIDAGLLFKNESDWFGSGMLLGQMEYMERISDKNRKAAEARWYSNKQKKQPELPTDADAMQTHSTRIADAMHTQCKVMPIYNTDTYTDTDNEKDTVESKHTLAPKKSANKPSKTNYAEYVSMTNEEHQKLVDEHGEQATAWMIKKLDNYKGSTGKKYKDDYRAILSWVIKSWREETNNGKTIKRDIDYITDPAGSGEPDYSFADLERIDRERWATENAKKRS